MAKVLVSIDDALLRRVDKLAGARGVSRSAYLAGLAQGDLARLQGPGSTRVARRALAQLDDLFDQSPPEDSTLVLRAERDAR